MFKNTNKANITFIFSAVFYILQAFMTVFMAFLLQRVVDAAGYGNSRDFFVSFILLVSIWPLDILFTLLASWFNIHNVKEMLKIVKNHRLSFLFKSKKQNFKYSDEISFFTADVDILKGQYYGARLSLFHLISLFLFSLIALLYVNWILTLAVATASLLPLIVPRIFGKSMMKTTKEYSDKSLSYVKTTSEILENRADIIAYDAEYEFAKRHNEYNQEVEKSRSKNRFVALISSSLSYNIGFLVQITGVGIGSYFVLIGDISFGTLILILQIMGNLIWPISQASETINYIKSAKPILEKAKEKFLLENTPKHNISSLNKEIEIKNLAIKFDDKYIFKNINLKFEKGKKYAIYAESGFGKSSIASALSLELDDYEGQILLDGVDIKHININDYRKIIKYARQSPFLFTDTLLNNITFLKKDYNSDKLKEVIDISGIDLSEIPLDRIISNDGNISGGEKQRIALARSILSSPEVLILDEITSAIDIESSKMILKKLFDDKELTCIFITHENNEDFKSLFDEIIILV